MFKSDWLEKVIWGFIVFVVIIMIYLSIQNSKNYISEGKVISKEHSEMTTMFDGNGLMIIIPESYSIRITDGNKTYSTSIDKNTYNKVNVGDWFKIK